VGRRGHTRARTSHPVRSLPTGPRLEPWRSARTILALSAAPPCRGQHLPRRSHVAVGIFWTGCSRIGRDRPPLSQPGGSMRLLTIARSLALVVLTVGLAAAPAKAAQGKLHSLSPHLKDAVDLGRASASERHRVVVSLDVRDREGLEAFLADVQDPSSPRYRQFLSQAEFDALYAPTEAQEQAVVDHLRGAGPRVTERFPNRLLRSEEHTSELQSLRPLVCRLLLEKKGR